MNGDTHSLRSAMSVWKLSYVEFVGFRVSVSSGKVRKQSHFFLDNAALVITTVAVMKLC